MHHTQSPAYGNARAVQKSRCSETNSRVAQDCVVELVGLEPTTRVLWNVGVSDQLTLSDTRHSSSKRAAVDGNFYNREIFGCRHACMEVPVLPGPRQPSRRTAPPLGAFDSIGLPLR